MAGNLTPDRRRRRKLGPDGFGDARATLAGQLRRNLDHWSGAIPGHVKGYRDQYEEALARLEEATRPIVLTLRWHEVSITPGQKRRERMTGARACASACTQEDADRAPARECGSLSLGPPGSLPGGPFTSQGADFTTSAVPRSPAGAAMPARAAPTHRATGTCSARKVTRSALAAGMPAPRPSPGCPLRRVPAPGPPA